MLVSINKILDKLTNIPEENIITIIQEAKEVLDGNYCVYCRKNNKNAVFVNNGVDISETESQSIIAFFADIFNDSDISTLKEPLVISDLNNTEYGDRINSTISTTLGSYMGAPVRYGKKFIGCLAITSPVPKQFTSDDLNTILMFAMLVSLEEQHNKTANLLKRTDDRYEAVFENANDCILILEDTVIVDINNKGCRMFGYEKAEIVGKSTNDLTPVGDLKSEKFKINENRFNDAALKGEPQQFEWVHEKKDGTVFYCDISLTNLKNSEKYNLLAIIRDVSNRKEYENKLIEDSEKALESSRMKSISLASMSHELRTPLNSIIGFSDLLLDEETTDDEKEMFSKLIQTAGRSLMQLIGDIVDISKIEAGQVTIEKTMVSVNSFLQEVLFTFKQEKESRDRLNIELKLVLSDKASDLKIETDPHRLQQIFNNLLTNSLKFIDEGFIEFGYLTITPGYIQFYVKDTGVGIDTSKKEKIFEQYGQDKDNYSRNREGTGLGLAISKSFVELLGGNIWLDSEVDEGSTFYFTIPFNTKSGYNDNYFNNSINTGGKKWSNHTILIADDVEENYVFLVGVLSHTGANIIWAKNGQEAVDFCNGNNNIEIVLMDIRMPLMDGLEASRLIKSTNPDIHIIAQTAFASREDEAKCFESGCDYYFKKPINHDKLFKVISNYFD
jgi:PAS domain S-box-containing protein